jgi:Flp pilus assembly protein TadD
VIVAACALALTGCRIRMSRSTGSGAPAVVAPSAADGLLAQGNDKAALPILQKEAAARPKDALLLMKLAACQGRLGQYDAATTTYLQAVNSLNSKSFQASSPDEMAYREANKTYLLVGCYFSAGLAQLKLGNLKEAQKLCDQARSVDASYPGVHDLQGHLCDARGETQKAIEEYRQLTTLAPKLASGHRWLADVLVKAGDKDAARQEYGKCLELTEDADERKEVEAALAKLGAR